MAAKNYRHMSLSEAENVKKPGYARSFVATNKNTKSRNFSVSVDNRNDENSTQQNVKVIHPKRFSLRSVSDDNKLQTVANTNKQRKSSNTEHGNTGKENRLRSVSGGRQARQLTASGRQVKLKEDRLTSKIPLTTGLLQKFDKSVEQQVVKQPKENESEDQTCPDNQYDENNNENENKEKYQIILPTIQLPPNVVNIDIEDGMYEYSGDLIAYIKELEKDTILPGNYLEGGSTLPQNRCLVIDWMIQVCNYFNFCQETLFYSVYLLDSVISKRDIKGDRLQLVSVACIWIASKLEEYFPADLSKLAYLTQNSYTVQQIVKMETVVLNVLKFKLHVPCVHTILKRYVMAALRHNDQNFTKTCQLILEINMIQEKFPTVRPSLQVAGSVAVALILYHVQAIQFTKDELELDLDVSNIWTKTLEYYTDYTLEDVLPHVLTMIRNMISSHSGSFDGARKKYSSQSKHAKLALSPHLMIENLELSEDLVTQYQEKQASLSDNTKI